jgi:hypothetical protein
MLYQTFHTAGDKIYSVDRHHRRGGASSTMKTVSVSATPPADGDGDGVADAQDVCPR